MHLKINKIFANLDYKKELRMIKKLGLKGIKLHPDYQNTYFDLTKYLQNILLTI